MNTLTVVLAIIMTMLVVMRGGEVYEFSTLEAVAVVCISAPVFVIGMHHLITGVMGEVRYEAERKAYITRVRAARDEWEDAHGVITSTVVRSTRR
jgi:ABC-type dipeptide/oligopeptide/nickel transport system permease component